MFCSVYSVFHRANLHSSATLEVFACFFLSCKTNARLYIIRKDGARSALFPISYHSGFESQKAFQPKLLIVLFYALFVCKCVLCYCHWVSTQLQLTNIFWVWVCSLRYPACNAHAPYCHLWPARFYNIFPHYLKNCMIFGEKLKKNWA